MAMPLHVPTFTVDDLESFPNRLVWSPPELSQSLTLDLGEVFAGLE